MGTFSAEHRGHAITYDPTIDAFVTQGLKGCATLEGLKKAIDHAIDNKPKTVAGAPVDEAPTVYAYNEDLDAYVPAKAVAVDERGLFLLHIPGEKGLFRERLNFERTADSDAIGLSLDPAKTEDFAAEHAKAKELWHHLRSTAGSSEVEREALAGDRITFGDLLSALPPFSPPQADDSGVVTIEAFGWSAQKGGKNIPKGQWKITSKLDKHCGINPYSWKLGEMLGKLIALATHKLPNPIRAVIESGDQVTVTGLSTYRHVFAELMTPLATALLKGGAEAELAKATPLPGDGSPWPRPWQAEATRMTALNAAGQYRNAICGSTYRRTPSALAITAEIGERMRAADRAREAFEALCKAPPLMTGEDRMAIAAVVKAHSKEKASA